MDTTNIGSVTSKSTSNGNTAHYAGPNARHLDTCNVLWADGHVKSLRIEKFYNADATKGPTTGPRAGVATEKGLSNCLRINQDTAGTECGNGPSPDGTL